MSGTALTTVSPSRVRMRRRVVWVAGCWGPKLRVQRYSLSVPWLRAAASRLCSMASAIFKGMASSVVSSRPANRLRQRPGGASAAPLVEIRSALRPRDGREVVPLAAAAQRVVLAQREGGVLVRHQDAPQVGVALEDDPVHVVHL